MELPWEQHLDLRQDVGYIPGPSKHMRGLPLASCPLEAWFFLLTCGPVSIGVHLLSHAQCLCGGDVHVAGDHH